MGDVDLRDSSFSRGLELDDVEIDGDLVLDRADVCRHLRLLNVAISGRLRAERVTADAIEAPSLRVTGAYDRTQGGTTRKELPTIHFGGRANSRGLNLERGRRRRRHRPARDAVRRIGDALRHRL
jgi:hypothetical protein